MREGEATEDYISPSDARLGRGIRRKLPPFRLRIDDIRLGSASAEYWWENIATLKRYDIRGPSAAIAILDTGCAENYWDAFNVDRARSLDLSGEGLRDDRSHGTVVSALTNLVATGSPQYVVKLFSKRSTVSPGEMAQRIATALDHVEKVGASCINASWNKLTYPDGHDRDPRPGHFCACAICSMISAFVRRTDISVFVSEGNYRYHEGKIRSVWSRPDRAWACPTSANYATPVIARHGDDDFYNNNFNSSYAVPAPGRIAIARSLTFIERLIGARRLVELDGSSFAAPLVSGTYALLCSALLNRGYPSIPIPARNHEEGDRNAAGRFNFPLELFFVPPDHRQREERERHSDWSVVFTNAKAAIEGLARRGKDEDAGELSCLFADLMRTAYLRMGEHPLRGVMAEWMLSLYVFGLEILLQTRLAIGCDTALGNALSAAAVAKSRGYDVSETEPRLMELNRFFETNRLNLLLKLDEGEWGPGMEA